ncbi:hypothetical protein [Salipiger bermudensis]|uniref:Uncharacterized protein n=1 Tax=Salipiger bermudensis (strain DSM 26914 / JCM 13377 / KCTC 12554 / HTCC2601) TaxID=314265 RepID=Q0FKG6_SALBH|nr:hypothetical protein [Salipiger bermudensis]EAU44688.1 hypothetical protein R2601_18578 [Salipiger bermudensis HTCC2601]|tara:strand:+ start:223 stop:381 length:159 start_codon:yes stop_codon:yes gene_type:complete
MARGFQKMPIEDRAAALIFRWREMVRLTGILAAPSMLEILVQRGKKLVTLPF